MIISYGGYIYLASNGGDAEVHVEVEIDGSPPIYYPPVAHGKIYL